MAKNETLIEGVELKIDGETYRLAYDFAKIRAAERMINAQCGAGERKVNLLAGIFLLDLDARQFHALLFASLMPKDSKKPYTSEFVDGLIRMDTYAAIYDALMLAWAAAMPDPEMRKKLLEGPTQDGAAAADQPSGN